VRREGQHPYTPLVARFSVFLHLSGERQTKGTVTPPPAQSPVALCLFQGTVAFGEGTVVFVTVDQMKMQTAAQCHNLP